MNPSGTFFTRVTYIFIIYTAYTVYSMLHNINMTVTLWQRQQQHTVYKLLIFSLLYRLCGEYEFKRAAAACVQEQHSRGGGAIDDI